MAAETTDITSSPTRNPAKPISSFLGSPTRILNGFLGRTTSQSAMDHSTSMSMSPTSTLDAKQFLNIGHHIGYEKTPNLTQKSSPTRNHNPVCTEKRPDSLGVSLALIEDSRRGQVLFGSKLKIQIPSLISPVESPVGSPGDFGTKTPRNLPPLLSSVVQAGECPSSPEGLSLSEMELSEDYTCVITHGPNPKTTRIFGNCVVEESCCEVMKGNCSSLSSCQNCSINHGDEQSIYNYRGSPRPSGHFTQPIILRPGFSVRLTRLGLPCGPARKPSPSCSPRVQKNVKKRPNKEPRKRSPSSRPPSSSRSSSLRGCKQKSLNWCRGG